MATARIYYRVQPAGLGIAGHRSLTSNDETPFGVDVFDDADSVRHSDTWRGRNDTDEVVVIASSDEPWDNGDIEGVRLDPDTAEILARVPVARWAEVQS